MKAKCFRIGLRDYHVHTSDDVAITKTFDEQTFRNCVKREDV